MTGWFVSPDKRFIVTEAQLAQAWDMFDVFSWDTLEEGIPEDAVDADGARMDRNHRGIRLLALSTCLATAMGKPWAAGYDLMEAEPHWRTLVQTALDAYDKKVHK